MNIKRDPQLENGYYLAKLLHLEKVQSKHMEWLSWSFYIPEHGAKVGGVTTVSESSLSEPFQWAKALNHEIAKKESWGSEDVLGRWCTVVVEAHQDFRGRKTILVNWVKPPREFSIAREG
jgi:hypothetical protein